MGRVGLAPGRVPKEATGNQGSVGRTRGTWLCPCFPGFVRGSPRCQVHIRHSLGCREGVGLCGQGWLHVTA